MTTTGRRSPPRRGSVTLRRLTLFSCLLGGYPRIYQGPRNRAGEAEDEEGEESEETEIVASLADDSIHGKTHSSHCPKGQLTQAVAPRDTSRAPSFKTPSTKAPDSFDGTKAYKLRGFIQSCKLILHNNLEIFFSAREKVFYSTSFLTGRAGKWIEPYLLHITSLEPSYLLNNWQLSKSQLFTLFGDSNEVRKAEQELDSLRIKESGQAPLYIEDSRSLM
ncbi:hypothetical protein O181_083314 [Austropuccinia psidii MF-1]|uniref:DUF4939 domain-containing protein n=1 Tax=Austropuccinia psidii MF-1 TaxID=1389203 RepID=A0A9Q3FQY6_9BASI|nr:hypothetical protein [Austropuccinia psidii MF-1]